MNLSAASQADLVITSAKFRSIQEAIDATPMYGTTIVPPNLYKISEPLRLMKPQNLIGFGRGTRIVNTAGGDAIIVGSVNPRNVVQGITISGIYFAVSKPGTQEPEGICLNCQNLHRSKILDVSVMGGKYGLYMRGSLINEIRGFQASMIYSSELPSELKVVRGETAIGCFRRGSQTGTTEGPSVNANSFYHTLIEGTAYQNGVIIDDRANEGNFTFHGGCIEGMKGYGCKVNSVTAPFSFLDMHFEEISQPNILSGCMNGRLEGITGAGPTFIFNGCKNIKVGWSRITAIINSQTTANMLLEGVTLGSGDSVIIGDNIEYTFPYSTSSKTLINNGTLAGGRVELLNNDLKKLVQYKSPRIETSKGAFGGEALKVTKTSEGYQGLIFKMPTGGFLKNGPNYPNTFYISGCVYNPNVSPIIALVGLAYNNGNSGTGWQSFTCDPGKWSSFNVTSMVPDNVIEKAYPVDPIFVISGPSGNSLIFDLLGVKVNI